MCRSTLRMSIVCCGTPCAEQGVVVRIAITIEARGELRRIAATLNNLLKSPRVPRPFWLRDVCVAGAGEPKYDSISNVCFPGSGGRIARRTSTGVRTLRRDVRPGTDRDLRAVLGATRTGGQQRTDHSRPCDYRRTRAITLALPRVAPVHRSAHAVARQWVDAARRSPCARSRAQRRAG